MSLVPYLLRVSTQIAMNALVSVSVPISGIEGSVHSDKTELCQVKRCQGRCYPNHHYTILVVIRHTKGENNVEKNIHREVQGL